MLACVGRTMAERLHCVLNSLSGDLTSASFALLGEASSFMEIGKRGVWSRARVDYSCEASIHLCVLAIDDELSSKPAWMRRQLSIVKSRAACGIVQPLPMVVFDMWRAYEIAFRLLQSGGNIGKIVTGVD